MSPDEKRRKEQTQLAVEIATKPGFSLGAVTNKLFEVWIEATEVSETEPGGNAAAQ